MTMIERKNRKENQTNEWMNDKKKYTPNASAIF